MWGVERQAQLAIEIGVGVVRELVQVVGEDQMQGCQILGVVPNHAGYGCLDADGRVAAGEGQQLQAIA